MEDRCLPVEFLLLEHYQQLIIIENKELPCRCPLWLRRMAIGVTNRDSGTLEARDRGKVT